MYVCVNGIPLLFNAYLCRYVCAGVQMCTYLQTYMNEEQLSCKYFIPIDILTMSDLDFSCELILVKGSEAAVYVVCELVF